MDPPKKPIKLFLDSRYLGNNVTSPLVACMFRWETEYTLQGLSA